MIRNTDKMTRLVYFFFSCAFLLYLAPIAKAQGTYTAASCNYSDVNAVINGPTHTAANGDTINIPAGTCTWTSSLSITKNISIIGSGSPNTTPNSFGAGTLNTVIVDNIPNAGVIQAHIAYAPGALFRLSTLDIEPNGTKAMTSPIQIAGSCTFSGCPMIRLDNIGLGVITSWSNANDSSGSGAWLIRTDNVFGVIDHCSEGSANWPDFVDPELSSYLGVGGNGDNSWAQPDTFGSANAMYVENNVLYTQSAIIDTEIAPAGGAIGGGRYVARFNQVTSNNGFGVFGDHGLDTNGRPQGGRQIEVYGNNVECISNSCGALAGWRSGTGRVFGNVLTRTGNGFFGAIMSVASYRAEYTATSGWAACGGSGPYDTNDGVVHYSGTTTSGSSGFTMNDSSKSFPNLTPPGAPYSVYNVTKGWWAEIASNTATSIVINGGIPEQTNSFSAGDNYQILRATVCADQPGRGQGNYVSGTPMSPASALTQVLDPIYEWNNTASVLGGGGNVGSYSLRMIGNRDWYTDNSGGHPQAQTSPTSPFNGTSGVGFGTLANRPTTCTPGVGYFATDQGTWNKSGNNFGQGELFVCTSTNAWSSSAFYTPYTYPHPLIDGGAGAGGNPPPNPPTLLKVTVQ